MSQGPGPPGCKSFESSRTAQRGRNGEQGQADNGISEDRHGDAVVSGTVVVHRGPDTDLVPLGVDEGAAGGDLVEDIWCRTFLVGEPSSKPASCLGGGIRGISRGTGIAGNGPYR